MTTAVQAVVRCSSPGVWQCCGLVYAGRGVQKIQDLRAKNTTFAAATLSSCIDSKT